MFVRRHGDDTFAAVFLVIWSSSLSFDALIVVVLDDDDDNDEIWLVLFVNEGR